MCAEYVQYSKDFYFSVQQNQLHCVVLVHSVQYFVQVCISDVMHLLKYMYIKRREQIFTSKKKPTGICIVFVSIRVDLACVLFIPYRCSYLHVQVYGQSFPPNIPSQHQTLAHYRQNLHVHVWDEHFHTTVSYMQLDVIILNFIRLRKMNLLKIKSEILFLNIKSTLTFV